MTRPDADKWPLPAGWEWRRTDRDGYVWYDLKLQGMLDIGREQVVVAKVLNGQMVARVTSVGSVTMVDIPEPCLRALFDRNRHHIENARRANEAAG